MINYLLEMLICQALFLGLYQVFKAEPFFRVNRMYLLLSLLISFLLPLVNFGEILPYQVSQTYVEWLQPLQIGGEPVDEKPENILPTIETSSTFQLNIYHKVYGIGLGLYLLWFIIRNRKVFHYLNLNSFEDYKFKPLVILPKTSMAFSFWDRIYLGADIPETQRQVILEHEYQHLKKKHSLDILMVEVMQWFLWFNPLMYLYKTQLRQIHEFEADQSVTTSHSKMTYINTLLNQNFGSQNVSFINTFFHTSNLKKRIKMLQHAQSSNLKKLKYLLILPVMVLAILVSCSQDETFTTQLSEEEKQEQMEEFFELITKEKPSLFDRIGEKQDLKTILNAYDLDIKNGYSKIEKEKIQIITTIILITGKYREERDYFNRLENEYQTNEALRQMYMIAKERVSEISGENENQTRSDSDIPFVLLDNPPHPESCKDLSSEALKKCVSEFISTHVNKNFDTGLATELGLTGRNRVSVQFKIDKNGNIVNVRARGPHPKLEQEAQRVIKTLPQMIPGQVDGENVGVLYGLPINFVIAE